MATKKQAPKAAPNFAHAPVTISNCQFHGGVSDARLDVVLALANAMTEQAKAIQAIAASIKEPGAMIRIGGAA